MGLGGVVAGLLSNVLGITGAALLFRRHAEELQHRMGVTPGPEAALLHITMRLLMGLGLVWLYAAVRPRFGPGPKTAAGVGAFLWLFSLGFAMAATAPYKLHPPEFMAQFLAWGFVEVQVVAYVGCRLYRE